MKIFSDPLAFDIENKEHYRISCDWRRERSIKREWFENDIQMLSFINSFKISDIAAIVHDDTSEIDARNRVGVILYYFVVEFVFDGMVKRRFYDHVFFIENRRNFHYV
jgi:hypothetical protein